MLENLRWTTPACGKKTSPLCAALDGTTLPVESWHGLLQPGWVGDCLCTLEPVQKQEEQAHLSANAFLKYSQSLGPGLRKNKKQPCLYLPLSSIDGSIVFCAAALTPQPHHPTARQPQGGLL